MPSNEKTINRANHGKDHPYFKLVNSIPSDTRISIGARWLLSYLLSKPDHWRIVIKDVMRVAGVGKDKAYDMLNELMGAGYVTRERQTGSNGQVIRWRYLLYEEPLPGKAEVASRGKTTSGFSGNVVNTESFLVNTEKKLIADAIDDAASPVPLNDDLAAAEAALKARVEPPIENHPDEEIIGHRFTQYLMDEFKVGAVTKDALKALKAPIYVSMPNSPEPVATGTVLWYYSNVDGFKDFVEEMVPRLANIPGTTLLNAIQFLRHIEREGSKVPHWNEWYEQNKRFIEPKHQPQKEKIKPVYDFDVPEEWK